MATYCDMGSAVARASTLARRRGDFLYVVRDGGEFAVADEFDLHTWWQGATVMGEVTPEGTFESSD
jgi:hypothetical protein